MRVLVGKAAVDLADDALLGVGGEARVFRWGDTAVKLWHADVPALAVRRAKIASFPPGLPAEVVGPRELVRDESGQILGFTMPVVEAADELVRLSQRAWREGVVSSSSVVALFRNLRTVLSALHERGVVVGDLNDGNVLFSGARPWLIDADSMQWEGFPCVVAHERFLDPRLYGADLAKGAAFTPGSDWYAYAVMLFASLLYVHPFGGIHRGLPTLLRRAEARRSILGPEVQVPRAAVHYQVLPDDLLGWFEDVFERDRREAVPTRLLDLDWQRCRCGTEHARPLCPECAPLARGDAVRTVTRVNGRCTSHTIVETRGRVLCAAVQGKLRFVVEEDGVIRREDGSIVTRGALEPGMRFAISDGSTWIGKGGVLLRLENERALARTATGTLGRDPMFDACSTACYRVHGEWLEEVVTGARVGKVLDGQTWLRVGERLGFGFYRAGLCTFFFLFRVGKAGLTDVRVEAPQGKIVEADAVFDDSHVLLSLATEQGGRRRDCTYLVGQDGRVIAHAEGLPCGGKALFGGHVVCATDDGLLSLGVDRSSGLLVPKKLFSDTRPFVEQGFRILPGPGGAVFVVTTKDITEVRHDAASS
ncbi:MAG: hypothetical protein HYY06_11620 [Deltaproteobacteria bacterium]|nr:hypothetical protein [Deltaproteobacteria bacterium]